MAQRRILLAAPGVAIGSEEGTGHYVRRAFQQLGHHVDLWDYRREAAMHGIAGMNSALITEAANGDYDLMLTLKGEVVVPPSYLTVSAMGVKTALWHFDPWISVAGGPAAKHIEDSARSVDHFFTIAKGLVPKFVDLGVPASWLLEAADPKVHFPAPAAEKGYGVGFVGTVNDPGAPGRLEWMERLAAEFQGQVHVWGSNPGRFEKEAFYHGRAVGDAGLRDVITRTKVNLGRDRNPEIERSYGARLFRTLACGGFLLTNETLGIHTDFGDAVWTYEDDEACVAQVRQALAELERCAEVAARGRKLVLEKHTFVDRCKELLRRVGL